MKLHLNAAVVIESKQPDTTPVYSNGFVIYYSSPHVCVCDAESGRIIRRLRYEDVGVIRVSGENLYVCTSDVYVHRLDDFDNVRVITLSKALISKMEVYLVNRTKKKFNSTEENKSIESNDTKGSIIEESNNINTIYGTNCQSNTITHCDNDTIRDNVFEKIVIAKTDNKIHLVCDGEIIRTRKTYSGVTQVFLDDEIYGYATNERCMAYKGDELVFGHEIEDLNYVFIDRGGLYTVDYKGEVIEWRSGIVRMLGTDISCVCYIGGRLYWGNGVFVYNVSVEDLIKHGNEKGFMIDNIKAKVIKNEIPNINNKINSFKEELHSTIDSDDNSIEKSDDNSIEKSDDNSIINSDDNSIEKSDDNSIEKSDDNSIINSDDNSIINSDDNSIEKSDDNSINSDDNSIINSIESFSDIEFKITAVSENLIEMGNILIVQEKFQIRNVFVFNDDVVDMVKYKNYILLGNTRGCIVYGDYRRYKEGESLFSGCIVAAHSDAITNMAVWNDQLVTGARDGTVSLHSLRVTNNGELMVQLISSQLLGHGKCVTALDYNHGILAVARNNQMLEIFRLYNGNCVNETIRDIKHDADGDSIEYNDHKLSIVNTLNPNKVNDGGKTDCNIVNGYNLEAVATEKGHTKQINHVLVTQKFILTSSSDKTAQIRTHLGRLLRIIQMDRVICAFSDESYIAVCSHKAIKVFDASINEIVHYQLKKPVLSGCFYQRHLITNSDIVRIYDITKKKCVTTYNFGIQNAWTFTFPFIAGDNKIVIITDETEKVLLNEREQRKAIREEEILLEKYRRDGDYERVISILDKTNRHNKIIHVMAEAYEHTGKLDFLTVFSSAKHKLFNILLKSPALKYAPLFAKILHKEITKISDINLKTKLLRVLEKHYNGVTELLINLEGAH